MFDRVSYKKKAREQLKGNYSAAVMVTLTYFLVCVGFSGFVLMGSSSLALLYFAATGILTFAAVVFFLQFTRKNPDERICYGSFIAALSHWVTGILSFLWYMLWATLWTFLLFVPGVVKIIAYSQMFFILAENPAIGVRKAMKMSIVMTKGYKGELFVMCFSFLGWVLLTALTAGILALWIAPYIYVSFANAYLYLKERALQSAMLTPADFLPEGEEQKNQETHHG